MNKLERMKQYLEHLEALSISDVDERFSLKTILAHSLERKKNAARCAIIAIETINETSQLMEEDEVSDETFVRYGLAIIELNICCAVVESISKTIKLMIEGKIEDLQ